MEDDNETFNNYSESVVYTGRVLPIFVTAITSLLLFVPVIMLSLRPSQEIQENNDNENFVQEDNFSRLPVESSPAESSAETESSPLLRDNTNNSKDICTSSQYRSDSDKIEAKFSKSKQSTDLTLHQLDSSYESSNTEEDEEGRINALRFSDPITSAFEKLKILTLNNLDFQSRKMLGLGLPYLIQSLSAAGSKMIQMAVVGHQLGVEALRAYVVIDLFVKLTSDTVGYVIISGNTMISQIVELEDENRGRKIGSYLQLSIIFYLIGMIPVLLFWSLFSKEILLYLGVDPDMAEEGQIFAVALVVGTLVDAIASAFEYTLDVVGLQIQSTITTFIGEVLTTSFIVFLMCYQTIFPTTSLAEMGWAYVVAKIFYIIGLMTAIYSNGWMQEYWGGLFSSPVCASRAAVKLMLTNTVQYVFSNFLFEGEWQILVIFARSLGSAEVAAWGVLGIIWEELESIVMAISEGCEARVAVMIGKGDAKTAKLVTYKAIWICFLWGIYVSIIFYIFGDEIPRLITSDPILQDIVSFNLPMISLANMVSGIAIMGEHVLWCQNRAMLSTSIASGTSGLITLPLAGLSSYILHYNLIWQTAAVTLGAAAFAALSMHVIISSDWKQISKDVIAFHASEESDDDEA